MNAHTSILRDFGLTDEPAGQTPPKKTPSEDIEILLARARGQARSDGYARGAEDAAAEFDHGVMLALDSVKSSLDALVEDRARTKREVASSCRTILSTFLEAVAPRLAALNLAPELISAVQDAVDSSPDEDIVVEVAEAQFDEIAGRLEADGVRCSLRSTADLAPAEARVYWRNGFDQIDAQPAIDRAIDILDQRLTDSMAAAPVKEDEEL